MKKITLALVVFVLLFSTLPTSSVLAKKSVSNVSITVKNRTGGLVTLALVDQNGKRVAFSYEPGLVDFSVLEGRYTYYASTPCGVQSGVFNLNVSKQLDFFCNNDGREISLFVPSPATQAISACEVIYYYIWNGVRNYAPNYPKSAQDANISAGGAGRACYDGVSPYDAKMGLTPSPQ